MNAHRPDATHPLLLSIVFSAVLLLAPMITHAADKKAEQPASPYPEQTMLAMNDIKGQGHADAVLRQAPRAAEADRSVYGEDLALKLMMHRLAIGQ